MEKKKILLVDDEPDFQKPIKARLEHDGYEVSVASSGQEALEKYAEEKPSAVLLDIMMPGMNGLEVLEKIRKVDRDMPVFITTAFTSEERFKMANKLNATGFILKTGNFKDHIVNISEAIKLSEKYKE